jgi:hypothetical protein
MLPISLCYTNVYARCSWHITSALSLSCTGSDSASYFTGVVVLRSFPARLSQDQLSDKLEYGAVHVEWVVSYTLI